jgi:hypothetical protein
MHPGDHGSGLMLFRRKDVFAAEGRCNLSAEIDQNLAAPGTCEFETLYGRHNIHTVGLDPNWKNTSGGEVRRCDVVRRRAEGSQRVQYGARVSLFGVTPDVQIVRVAGSDWTITSYPPTIR